MSEVVVTQADRDAAWQFIPLNSITGQDREGFSAGKYDNCNSVQAFARHRIEALEQAAKVAEGHRYGDDFLDTCGMRREHRDHIATAIRNLQGEG